ncbi:MAG: S-adenosylmethionine:tRNA ribosyltransferase-isomerase, partial [Chitinophagaceae bacterium]
MSNPGNISINDYIYSLPEERIAKYPLSERDSSRLLIYQDEKISEDIYRNIAEYIPENSLVIFNDTKVIEARLLFQKPTFGKIEIFCLDPHENYADTTTAMQTKEKVLWNCLIGGASKWKHGQILEMKIKDSEKELLLQASYIEKRKESFIIEFSWLPAECSFAEILHIAGAIPLPPYIKRDVQESDSERYQTVYADNLGSVAAPTAGLHFTENTFKQLKEKKTQSCFLTLHVGAGTFKPLKSETLSGHLMHAEWINVSKNTIEYILKNLNNKIIAVGTTSLRTIESLYWLGVKISGKEIHGNEELYQWEAYALSEKNIPVAEALEKLIKWMDKNNMERLITKTQILIAPGYPFKIVQGLVTNFHQPQ